MGAIRVHDRRPGSVRLPVDAYEYGPVLDARRGRSPLHLGDLVVLPDGSRWPVVSSRVWRRGVGWRQAVAVGVDGPVIDAAPRSNWIGLHRLAG